MFFVVKITTFDEDDELGGESLDEDRTFIISLEMTKESGKTLKDAQRFRRNEVCDEIKACHTDVELFFPLTRRNPMMNGKEFSPLNRGNYIAHFTTIF